MTTIFLLIIPMHLKIRNLTNHHFTVGIDQAGNYPKIPVFWVIEEEWNIISNGVKRLKKERRYGKK
jgi:hypothetical protein